MSYSIIVLSEFNHPVGLHYIDELNKRDIEIDQIIFTQKREHFSLMKQFKERMGEDYIMPKTSDVLKDVCIPCYYVDDVNSVNAIKMIRSFEPDLIIIAAVGIIKEELLKIPKIGILNCHPGLFPKYRGCTCVEWAIFNDDPVGCTCHFITEKIDWGDVIMMESLQITRSDSYHEVRRKSLHQCAKVMAESVQKIIRNEYNPNEIKLSESEKEYFKPIDDPEMIIVKKKLKDEKYSHYNK